MSAIHQQLAIMLELQDGMNTKVNAQWRNANHEWYRAIWVECAELMDHYGWKWWKKQTPDAEQVALELIDIWHFGLSIFIQSGKSFDDIISKISSELNNAKPSDDFRADVEKFALTTLSTKAFNVAEFSALMQGVNMTFESLYSGYVGKNVLNFFRQDNGYKDGSYRKIWNDGREDNEHLVDVLAQMDTSSAELKTLVYEALKTRYHA